ncbi:hypothetical protein RJ639_013532 [Escallonia herrerae]|uniref:DUF4219 domain-containing protein n=1 Tax=Escallonia herrerae TaxID=1293975 RepID=A0AA88VI58_9ASTE|nr:hypothetical protein RJ639_013532 [Escallonia herrerae]
MSEEAIDRGSGFSVNNQSKQDSGSILMVSSNRDRIVLLPAPAPPPIRRSTGLLLPSGGGERASRHIMECSFCESFIVDMMTDLQAVGGMKKLNNSNYNTWSTCMMSYMQGQDLWEVVNGSELTQPEAEDANGTLRKWKIKAGKAMFSLKTTVEEDVLEHIRDATTPKQA